MSGKNIDDVLKQLSAMSAEQITTLSLKNDDLKIATPEHVEHRYIGRKKIPGMPFGLEANSSGIYYLRHIAVVRVPTDAYRADASAMVRRYAVMSTIAACACAVVAGVITALSYSLLNKHDDTFVLPPCTLTRILPDAVFCKNTTGEAGVDVGQLFPGERFRLDSILQGQTGFSATRLKDQRSVIFQADPKFYLKSRS